MPCSPVSVKKVVPKSALPGPIPALRPLHAHLQDELGDGGVWLVTATDGIVDALDTIHAVLEERLPPGGRTRP